VKARYALWPVMIFGAVSLASACSSDGGSTTGDTTVGGSDGEGGSGANTGATTSTGATDSVGGMTTDAGASTGATGGVVSGGAAGAAGAAGATGGDLCEGKDITCEDDDNPCTEDECNPATGECGIPRSETACDDGKYCNGEDTCDAGACTVHAGNPCGATCNEAGNYCECSGPADCPADDLGDWSECTYANECVEATTRSRPVTKYSCNDVGKCVAASPIIETEPCTRETDGTACTDNNNICDGLELCKNGSCVPQGASADPCKNNAALPYCYNGDPTCRVCKSANKNGSSPVGCSSGQYCCAGECKASACLTIVTTKITTIGGSIATFAQ
jgi:hypothetical protein